MVGWWQPFNSSILLALNINIMTWFVALRVSKQSNVTYQYLESAVILVLTNNLLQVPTEFRSKWANTIQNAHMAVTKHWIVCTRPPLLLFCHFKSCDGGSSRIGRKLQDFDGSAVEYWKNLKPSEIVYFVRLLSVGHRRPIRCIDFAAG